MDKVNNFIENLKQNDLREIDLSRLLEWKYLIEVTPTKHFIYEQWIYVFVLINLILAGIGFIFLSKRFFIVKPKYRLIRKISFIPVEHQTWCDFAGSGNTPPSDIPYYTNGLAVGYGTERV